MSEFINKAQNDNNFNNYGQTVKVGRKLYSNTKNKDNATINASGEKISNDNKRSLESNIDIDAQGTNSVLAKQSSENSPCPPGQTKAGFTANLQYGSCGCWIDTGVSLLDIVTAGGLGAASAVWNAVTKGASKISQRAAAIASTLNRIKGAAKFDEYYDNLWKQLKKQQENLLNIIGQDTLTLETLRSAILNAQNKIIKINQDIEQGLVAIDELLGSKLQILNEIERAEQLGVAPNPDYIKTLEYFNQLEATARQKLVDLQKLLPALQKTADRQTEFNLKLAILNGQKDALKEIDDKIADFAQDKQNALDALTKIAEDEVDNMTAWQILQEALGYVGIALAAMSISREKICFGQNTRLDEQCQCVCIDEDYQECPATQNPVSGWLIDQIVPLVPKTEELLSCVKKCCGGQVLYQFGSDPCDCACLGDLIFGTPVGGGGPADGTWIAGEGCGCLNGSSRGKCVSADLKNKAIAQGKRWNGAICDFECPDGPPADCVGNATRPPKINYGGILLDDECGECVCDGDSFSCNTDEGYVKDTSPGVCDCVYDPVTTENIYLVP